MKREMQFGGSQDESAKIDEWSGFNFGLIVWARMMLIVGEDGRNWANGGNRNNGATKIMELMGAIKMRGMRKIRG